MAACLEKPRASNYVASQEMLMG